MVKKVILTESQYTRLTNYINEKKVVKGGAKNSSKNNSNSLGDFTNWVNTEIIPIFIRKIKPNTGINIKFGNKIINLCCISRNGNTFTFTLNTDTNIKELKNWKVFTIKFRGTGKKGENLYKLNKELIQTTNGQSFDLKFLASYGDTKKPIWIRDIYDIELAKCGRKPPKKVKTKPEVKQKVKPIKTEPTLIEPTKIKPDDSNEYSESEVKAMMDLIINDPLMKKAFYSQPTLWNLLVSAVKGENPRGTGIIPAMELVRNYETSKLTKELGESGHKFKRGKSAKFKFYRKTPDPSIKDIEYVGVVDYEVGDKGISIIDDNKGFKVVILSEVAGLDNAFEVEVYMIEKDHTTGLPIKDSDSKNKNNLKFTDPKYSIVQFIEEKDSGYSND
jgi:hypothetical protein